MFIILVKSLPIHIIACYRAITSGNVGLKLRSSRIIKIGENAIFAKTIRPATCSNHHTCLIHFSIAIVAKIKSLFAA